MDDSTREQIEGAIRNNPVVLFMKGTPRAPRCGFSATVAGILDELVGEYKTVDVLADGKIRDGIKEFSEWPTIPQLYVKGEFVGGCDIVREMYESGELHETLGVRAEPVAAPRINLSPSAAQALGEALADARSQEPGTEQYIRVEIDGDYQHGLSIGGKQPRDIEVPLQAAGHPGIVLLFDRSSARRAEGLSIDYVQGPEGPAFKLENPNEPPRVKSIDVHTLKEKMAADASIELLDVRSQKERDLAKIEGSKLLDREVQQYVLGLDKSTPLYFHCHHGQRSQQAAAYFLSQGFQNVFNVAGGIDAWSIEVDPQVPRY
jgi:monothiol glutaredoxin